MTIRLCRDADREVIFTIINAAAEAYRGVIPEDCFHDPYTSAPELAAEIAAGVKFWGYEADNVLVAVMGIQAVLDVDLIRHAYVLPSQQRRFGCRTQRTNQRAARGLGGAAARRRTAGHLHR